MQLTVAESVGVEHRGLYYEEAGADPQSRTEILAALRLTIDNWRWASVPFYLRTGKRFAAQCTEIAIQFKKAPTILFKHTDVEQVNPNMLVLRTQLAEGIQMSFGAKVPSPTMGVGIVNMDFCYEDYFGNKPATGHETLIYDSLYKHADTIEKGWEIVQSVMDAWAALPPRDFPPTMPQGPGGPRLPAICSRTTVVYGAGSRPRISDARTPLSASSLQSSASSYSFLTVYISHFSSTGPCPTTRTSRISGLHRHLRGA